MLQLGYVHEIRFKPNVNFIRCVVQFVTIRAIKKLEKRPWRRILVKLQALVSVFNFIKIYTPPWMFSRFLNFANGIQSRNASHIYEHSDSEKDIAEV